jgi:hypothetical protein
MTSSRASVAEHEDCGVLTARVVVVSMSNARSKKGKRDGFSYVSSDRDANDVN